MIPKEILQVFQKEPDIGRSRLAGITGIGDRDARFYCRAWKEGYTEAKFDKPEEFIDKFMKELKSEKSIFKTTPYASPFTGKQKESAVLLFSDPHIGKVNRFLNFETGVEEETYNTKIFLKEAENLVQDVHRIIQLLSTSFQIDKLWIFSLGDIIDNDLIYRGQRFFIDSSSGEQLWQGIKALTDILKSFLKVFKEVEWVNIIGNHGRFTSRREEAPPANNFDYHIGKILQLAFANEERIKFTLPASWFTAVKINDFKYFLHHGDTVYSWMGLPYYGLVRKSKARRNEYPFDIETIGHFHSYMRIPISSRSFTIVNGGWIPKDDFAWKLHGVLSIPQQTFFGVSRKKAKTWRFLLDL